MSGGHDRPSQGGGRVSTRPGGGGGSINKKLYGGLPFPYGGIFSMCAECVYIFSMLERFFSMWGISFSAWGGGGGVVIFGLLPSQFLGEPLVVTFFTAQIFIIISGRGVLNYLKGAIFISPKTCPYQHLL